MPNKAPLTKKVLLLNATVATNATTSALVDRLGFDYVNIDIVMRPATATDSSAKWTVLKLMEGDTTDVAAAANISGLIGTTNATAATTVTAAEFVIPANNTTTAGGTTASSGGGGQVIAMNVDCRGRKRYLFLIAQANASHQTAFAMATLSRGEKLAVSASERNVAAVAVG